MNQDIVEFAAGFIALCLFHVLMNFIFVTCFSIAAENQVLKYYSLKQLKAI